MQEHTSHTHTSCGRARRRHAPAALLLAAALVLTSLGAGCSGEEGPYCERDADCRSPTHAAYKGPGKPYCHPQRHTCFEGCSTDADCRDKSKWWHVDGYPYCDPATHHCVQRRRDGGQPEAGQDARPDVRPDVRRDGPADAQRDTPRDTRPGEPALKKNGDPCNANAECQSHHCVQGVCCDSACTGGCHSCRRTDTGKSDGTCAPVTKGKDPKGQCKAKDPGGKCSGACDGKGGCDYRGTDGKECKQSTCDTSNALTLYTCSQGACKAQTPKSCGAYKCKAGKQQCPAACKSHADCVPDSACDRTQAHTSGSGKCVPPGKIAAVVGGSGSKAVSTMTAGIGKANASAPYVVVLPASTTSGKYDENVPVTKSVYLIGKNSPILRGKKDGPAITVTGGAHLHVQGLTITGATSGGTGSVPPAKQGDGLQCSSSKLTVVESTISYNQDQGIEGVYCDVTVRRSHILNNTGGGLKLSDGTFVVVNNVIADNGSSSSSLGGVMLTPSGSVTFYNNTIVNNSAKAAEYSGVSCMAFKTPLVNTIVWSTTYAPGQKLYFGCNFEYSDVHGGATGTGNINQDPLLDSRYEPKSTSPCIDAGTTVPTNVTVIDIIGTARKKGGGVDMGAYEVK